LVCPPPRQDEQLEDIADGVRELNVLAQEIGDETKKQNIMLEDLDMKIDNVNDHLENVNTKMKTTLEKVRLTDSLSIMRVYDCV
jgi:methyl-accepting chemotaxis protein